MEGPTILENLGRGPAQDVPGYSQLMRSCDIEGHLIYRLTTFFEKDGMVTAFAFDQPMTLTKARRWWDNVYCLVVTSREGKPVVLAAQKKMHSPRLRQLLPVRCLPNWLNSRSL